MPAANANGPGPQPMSLVQLAELPRIVDPQLSPNGQSVVYMRTSTDWNANRLTYRLWRKDAGTAPPVALTSGPQSETPGATRWSPDGSSILFLRAGQLWIVPAAGGTARAITKHATPIVFIPGPTWSPDGATVYFVAADPDTTEERERERLRDDLYPFEEHYKQRQLWNVNVTTGAEKQLTSGGLGVASFRLSRDGKRIAVERTPTPFADDEHLREAWVIDAGGENARQLTRNAIEEGQPELSPDNSQVLFLASANEKLEPEYNLALFVVPASGGTPKLVSPDFPYAVDQATWSADGASIFVVANMGVHSEIFRIDLATRRATQLTDGRHFIPTWSVVPTAGRMLVQFDEPSRYGDVWTLPIEGGEPTRLTNGFEVFERTHAVPRQEKFTWKSNDGTTIEGVLMYPFNYTPGTRYPLVVQLHGGPEDSDKFGAGSGLLLNYFPVLTGKGWFVLRPNYRGSTGYGNAFLRDVIPGYFRNMQLDVLSGVDALVKQGLVDGDRMVVMGWSAGGHLTNKLVTMTTRFKAASSGAGGANWISMASLSDRREDRTIWFGGTPWQKNASIATFWNASPVKDAANVKTPTLFFVGENDQRVPKEQSIEMYRALKSHNVPTRLYIAQREAHTWGELRHQIAKANAELAWFAKYALHTPYVPEAAPAPAQ
jgi:dipeptidyl aminopeptidase/acylaminoacyl peptidase